nr:hypothetical protein [uncultured Brevundimonas sp.]
MQRDFDGCARFGVDRLDVDASDQVADGVDHLSLRRIGAVAGLGKPGLKVGDSVGVVLGRLRVQADRRRRVGFNLGQRLPDFDPFAVHLGQLGANDGGRGVAGQQGVGASVDRAVQFAKAPGEWGAPVLILCRPLAPSLVIGTDVGGHGLGRQQALAQAGQHPLLDHGAGDVAIICAGCRALFPVVDADQSAGAERSVGPATASALQQSSQQAGAATEIDQLRRIDVSTAENAGLGAVP